MIILFNSNESEGSIQLNFLKELFYPIELIDNEAKLFEKLKVEKANLVLISGENFSLLPEDILIQMKYIIFLIFPPLLEKFSIKNEKIRVSTKEDIETKIHLYDIKLLQTFIKNGITEKELHFFFSKRLESDKAKIIIRDNVNDILIKIEDYSQRQSYIISTLMLDQYSIMNEPDYINLINSYILRNYQKLIEEITTSKKEKRKKAQDLSLKHEKLLLKLIILTLYYFLNKKQEIINKKEFWNKINQINLDSLNIINIQQHDITRLALNNHLIEEEGKNFMLNNSIIIRVFQEQRLMAIYRRILE